jgi:hypothetical protein
METSFLSERIPDFVSRLPGYDGCNFIGSPLRGDFQPVTRTRLGSTAFENIARRLPETCSADPRGPTARGPTFHRIVARAPFERQVPRPSWAWKSTNDNRQTDGHLMKPNPKSNGRFSVPPLDFGLEGCSTNTHNWPRRRALHSPLKKASRCACCIRGGIFKGGRAE